MEIRVDEVPTPADPYAVLADGDIEVLGRMPWSSNATLLTRVCLSDDAADGEAAGGEAMAIYKPQAGERPLRDFPPGLGKRETAAHDLDRHLGWDLIPPTVHRDGPHGPGSVQLFMASDPEQHFFTIVSDDAGEGESSTDDDDGRHLDWLVRLATFDLITNQTDRKSGHVLVAPDQSRLWAIDNGLSFHHDFKVRSVLWDLAGTPIPVDLVAAATRLADDGLPDDVMRWINPIEIDACRARAAAVAEEAVIPEPPWGDYSYPWPLV